MRTYNPTNIAHAFRVSHGQVVAWVEKTDTNFALSLRAQLKAYGRLSERQCSAVMDIVERDRARQANQQKVLDISPKVEAALVETLYAAFATAMENGIKRPRVTMDDMVIKPAPVTGNNPGALYVTGVGGQYLGKVVKNHFVKVPSCTEEDEKQVLALLSNPLEAMKAYGQRTGRCCICSKTLTNGESIEAGIGPICASKFGF